MVFKPSPDDFFFCSKELDKLLNSVYFAIFCRFFGLTSDVILSVICLGRMVFNTFSRGGGGSIGPSMPSKGARRKGL